MSFESAGKRVRWLHKRISEGYYPNAVRLSERFGISRRQATRDVEYMRRELGAPIEYDSNRRGFYYSSEFSLPASISVAEPDDYVEQITSMTDISGDEDRDEESTQMSIPYDAMLEIPDRLTALKLGKLITGRVSVRGADYGNSNDASELQYGKKIRVSNRYYCEFQSVEAFLGVLMAIGAPVKIVRPDWLRKRLIENAKLLLDNNERENSNVQDAQKYPQ